MQPDGREELLKKKASKKEREVAVIPFIDLEEGTGKRERREEERKLGFRDDLGSNFSYRRHHNRTRIFLGKVDYIVLEEEREIFSIGRFRY